MEGVHSEEFAHRCKSVEPTVFHFSSHSGKPFITVPNLKTDSWEKYFLEFIPEDEAVDLIGTSEGLLCYKVLKKRTPKDKPLPNKEIFLVVHNPFTRKWRRFVVPYTFNTLDGMLEGLAVDQDTRSYKVVLAFIEGLLPRTTLIYNSGANSWSVSAALSPALTRRPYESYCMVSRSICCDGELYWFVEEVDSCYANPNIKTLIKYNTELDTWFTATQHVHSRVAYYLHLTSFQKRPVIVNLFKGSNVFPEEFSGSEWNFTRFDAQDVARLLQAADHEGESSKLELKRGLTSGEPFFQTGKSTC